MQILQILQISVHKLDKFSEIKPVLCKHKVTNFTQEQTDSLNHPILLRKLNSE